MNLETLLGIPEKETKSLSSLLGLKQPQNDLGSLLGINK